jgi:tetratricopeptide (TPR) repeat protein
METEMQQRRMCAWSLACGVMCMAAVALAADSGKSSVRESMQRIFSSMRLLLPASVDMDVFRDPARTDSIRDALVRVSESASAVAEHARSGDQGVRFLGRSLQQEAQRTIYLFDEGAYESAQFSILQMTEYCVECHSRSPIPSDSPLSKGFVSSEQFEQLELEERARLQFATREFEAGLDTLDRLFASRDVPAAELLGAATNYLVVSLRVKQDFERPVAALRTLASRPDLWTYLRLDVERWIEALGSLAPRVDLSKSAPIEDAVAILSDAREIIRFPSDRQALVHYVVASTILQRFIEQASTNTEKARAYYLLGLTESRIGRSYWLALPEFFLETAIRLDPAGEAALQAYALIEEETYFAYSFDSEEGEIELPMDVERRLADLRRMIEQARGTKPPSKERRS